ncbi:PilN domain-containing protein [Candidatus Electronema sp. TJ]|uniref:PilN domain-containing protein n=1 Tax=Candidatus Electronema sp. TJ TaxID=3401573 RepID=UPI003AA8C335
MLRINLLPVKKIKQQAAAKRQLTFFGVVFAVLVALLLLIVVFLSGQVRGLNGDIARLEKKEKELAEILKQIEALEKGKDLIKKQTAIVEELEKKSALTANIMNEVANITPTSRMWLTDFEQSGGTLKLTGMALDNQTVAEYLQALGQSKCKCISNVTLTSSVMQVYAERNLKKFTLSASVAMPGAEPSAEMDGKKAGGAPAKAEK